jgi:hypothetical protein
VANATAGIMEALPLFGNKFPCIFPRGKGELQHAVSIPFTHFAVRRSKAQEIVAAPTRARDDFADAIHGIGLAFRVLRRKTFVGVLVSRKNQVSVRGVQVFL